MTQIAPLRTIVMPPRSDHGPSTHTLVLLHGYGANANDLLPLRDELAPTWTAIAMEAPHDLGPMGMPGGRAWFHIAGRPDGTFALDMEGAEHALLQLAREIPEAVDAAGSDMNNTVVMGFSQGAMLGHALLLRERLPMRGLAGCSGRMMRELLGDGSGVPTGLPVFLSHGTHDELIPVASGHELRTFYETHTPAEVTWCEEAIGHGIGPQTAAAMRAWFESLVQQTRPSD
jgi:phospholipase/carboxylesterase